MSGWVPKIRLPRDGEQLDPDCDFCGRILWRPVVLETFTRGTLFMCGRCQLFVKMCSAEWGLILDKAHQTRPAPTNTHTPTRLCRHPT